MSKPDGCALKITNRATFKAMLDPVHFEYQALLELSPVESCYILDSGPGCHLWKTHFQMRNLRLGPGRGVLMRELAMSSW